MERLPFDIELAKKIQSGEITGRIVTNKGEIVCLKNNYTLTNTLHLSYDQENHIMFVEYGNSDMLSHINEKLFIELSEEIPKHKYIYEFEQDPKKLLHTEKIEHIATKITIDGTIIRNRYGLTDLEKSSINKETLKHDFKVGNKIRIKNSKNSIVQSLYSGKCYTIQEVLDDEVSIIDSNFEKIYFRFDEIEPYEEKYEFKPFDKVLVRDEEEEIWQPRLYEMYYEETGKYYCQDGRGYTECIPYEGNEHLVGTTDS